MFNIEPETLFRIVDIAAVVANGLLGGAVARACGSTWWASCYWRSSAAWAAA